jgi:alpha-tubulin suppressor-like RCC1 family protein
MGNKSMSSTRPPTKNYGVTTTLKSYRSPINSPVLSIDIANVNGPLQPIFTPSKHIEKISSDDGTTVFVTNDGCLYIIKDTISEPTLIRMHGDSRVVEARVGFSRIIAIMEDGTAQARGTNQYSSLGLDGDAAEMTPLPTQNYGNERLILSSNMYSSALVISEASNVYIFGQT